MLALLEHVRHEHQPSEGEHRVDHQQRQLVPLPMDRLTLTAAVCTTIAVAILLLLLLLLGIVRASKPIWARLCGQRRRQWRWWRAFRRLLWARRRCHRHRLRWPAGRWRW